MTTNTGKLSFELVQDWAEIPAGFEMGEVPNATTDAQGRVYVLNRGKSPILVFDSDGKFLNSMGEGIFEDPHGACIDVDGRIYVVDRNAHVIVRLSPDGKVQRTIGTRDRASGEQSGVPFNRPTGVAISSEGEIYISDGYANSRIHKYAADGSLIFSWGGPGTHPGQFNLPHGICIDAEDRIYVADRENNRLQVFNTEGDFIKMWTDLLRPSDVALDCEGNLYVSELGDRVTVLSYQGEVLAQWGQEGREPGMFIRPHGLAVDAEGSVYVTEVHKGKRIQKFRRKS
jgi:DNA-binding beta-propeller fold protein YncE